MGSSAGLWSNWREVVKNLKYTDVLYWALLTCAYMCMYNIHVHVMYMSEI